MKSVSFPVYCVCRYVEEGDMARCDVCLEWFHESCIHVPPEVFKKKSVHWNCPQCKLVAIITTAWVYVTVAYIVQFMKTAFLV